MRILKAYNNIYVAIIFLFFFLGTLLAPLQLPPKIYYAVNFLLFALVILFHVGAIIRMNSWMFFSIVIIVPSGLLGLYMGWSFIDISADIARYLAPFLGYTAGLLLLNYLDYYRILYLLYGLLAYHLFLFYVSLVSKIKYVLQGGPLVEYASGYGLEVHFLYAYIAFFLVRKKIVSGFKKVLLIGYVIGFVLNPILIMSKARTVTMLLSFALIFIFFSNLKNKVQMIILAILVSGTLFMYFDNKIYNSATNFNYNVFQRFNMTSELFKTKKYSVDASTGYRITEIKNVFGMIYDKFPYSLPIGFGSGALFYDNHAKIKGGISQGNYRADGGIHDIFLDQVLFYLDMEL